MSQVALRRMDGKRMAGAGETVKEAADKSRGKC